MKILLEIPKSLLTTHLDRNHGANRFSRQLMHLLFDSKAFTEIFVITDAKPQQLQEYNQQFHPTIKLRHTTHTTLHEVAEFYGEPDIAFTSDLGMQRLLQVRNWYNYQFPVVGLVHSLGTLKSFDQLRETILHLSHKDRIICPSEHTRETLAKLASHWSRASFRKTSHVIPHGIDTNRFKPAQDKAALRAQLKLPIDAVILTHVARVNPFTKMDIFPLIQNFERICTEVPNAHLLLVGENQMPSYFNQIQAYIRKKGLTKRITCITEFDAEKVELFYQAGDVFTSLSDNLSESFGISIAEAMSTGLPVIISDIAGYRGAIQDGTHGYYIPTIGATDIHEFDLYFNGGSVATFGDMSLQAVALDNNYCQKIFKEILCSPEKIKKMGGAARQYATKRFNLETLSENYLSFFNALLEEVKDDPIIVFPDTHYKQITQKLAHGLTHTIENCEAFYITAYGRKVMTHDEPLFAFQKHLDTYKMIPILLSLLADAPYTLEALLEHIEGCTPSELKRNLLYMLKHDLINFHEETPQS